MEKWKPVIDHEIYEISDQGNVRKKHPKKGYTLMKVSPAPFYLMFNTWDHKKIVKLYVHREMMKAFRPNTNPELDHVSFKDGDIYNVKLNNLYWTSQTKRMKRRYREGGYTRGEDHFAAKLTNEDIFEIRFLWKTKQMNQIQLGAKFNIHPSTISNIVLGRYWSHLK